MADNEQQDILDQLGERPLGLDQDTAPTTVEGWLDSLPTTVERNVIVDYPASSDDGEGVPLSTRVPAQWIEIIDRIRQMPGTNLPDVWPKRSNFVRWSIIQGMQRVLEISKTLNEDDIAQMDIDPLLRAQITLEQAGGELEARAQTINNIFSRVRTIARAAQELVAVGELVEPANLINRWSDSAHEQASPFWRDTFLLALVNEPELADTLRLLIMGGHIVDERLIDMCVTSGVISRRPDEYSPDHSE